MLWLFLSGKCNSKARLDGKTAVVTGSNTGIGKYTALDFVRRGAKVIMACRDMKKAEEAAKEIRFQTQGLEGVGQVEIIHLDLGSLSSVRKCAKTLLEQHPAIHILVNNAGVMAVPKGVTEDGFETHFGVNHLGHFLLTCLLLPRIKKSAPARIVTVASHLYLAGCINFDDLNWEKCSYNATFAYGRSKLANILFTKELGKRLQGTGVTTYSLHPGVVATELSRNFDGAYFRGSTWFFDHLGKYFIKSPEQGAQTSIYCAVDEKAAGETGLYYSDCCRFKPLGKARDSAVAARLWEVSAQLVGLDNWDPFTASDAPNALPK